MIYQFMNFLIAIHGKKIDRIYFFSRLKTDDIFFINSHLNFRRFSLSIKIKYKIFIALG